LLLALLLAPGCRMVGAPPTGWPAATAEDRHF